jgi:hypothetical protein
MKTGRGRRRRAVVRAATVAVLAAAATIAPLARGADGPSPSPIPQGCRLAAPQPEAALKLNLVAATSAVKAIVAQQEVFDCYDTQSSLTQVKDVQTVIESVARLANGKTPTLTTVDRSIAAETCTKDLQTGRVTCKVESIPLATTDAPLARCGLTKGTYPFAPVTQPPHPTVMSSVTVGAALVDTVDVEQEALDCGGLIGDVYLFTQRTEAVAHNGFGTPATAFSGVLCLKNEATARVTACKLFTPRSA